MDYILTDGIFVILVLYHCLLKIEFVSIYRMCKLFKKIEVKNHLKNNVYQLDLNNLYVIKKFIKVLFVSF